MSQVYANRTGQKLFAAQLQLDALKQTAEQDELARRTYQAACWEAALFHLAGAYCALLHEIAAYYGLPATDIRSVRDLLSVAGLHHKVIGEANEISALEQDHFSWLAQLLHAYQRCWEPPQEHPSKSASERTLIALDETAEENAQSLASAGELWLNELRQLVAHVRDTMNEF